MALLSFDGDIRERGARPMPSGPAPHRLRYEPDLPGGERVVGEQSHVLGAAERDRAGGVVLGQDQPGHRVLGDAGEAGGVGPVGTVGEGGEAGARSSRCRGRGRG
ncbi:hypothetical protein ACWCQ0_46440 [Streptomyces massasporeus]